jgi:hypothetical protein
MQPRRLSLVYHARQVYWIDLLLLISAIPLVGWVVYGFIDAIQRNDGRGIQIWLGISLVTAFFVGLLVQFVLL